MESQIFEQEDFAGLGQHCVDRRVRLIRRISVMCCGDGEPKLPDEFELTCIRFPLRLLQRRQNHSPAWFSVVVKAGTSAHADAVTSPGFGGETERIGDATETSS